MTPARQAFTSFPIEPIEAGDRTVVRASPGARGVAPAILAEPTPDGDVRCNVCAHRCLVRPGRLGICGVRENRGGQLVSLVYGEVAAAIVEPIEKKPLYHVWPGTRAYSVGTQGCNLHCRFCQNWEIAQAPREGLPARTRRLLPELAVAEALVAGARAVAYTYTEPTVFLEYVLDVAALAREAGLGNVLVTNGYQTPEALRLLAPLVDAANVDCKSFDDRFYRRVCGARLAPVLDSMRLMRELGIWVEVTTLIIPGLNDDPRELAALASWIASELGVETPWHLSRFHPAFRMESGTPTPLATLVGAEEIGRSAGLCHVYVGNAPELGQADTRCAACGTLLLRRDGYRLVRVALREGRCPTCGVAVAGVGMEEVGTASTASRT